MSKIFKIIITTTKSGINIGEKKPYGHFLETLDHIPGSVIRGAFAKMLNQENENLFNTLFENDNKISFTDLYSEPETSKTGFSIPIPMTAVSCKYESGFCTEYDEDGKEENSLPHGVFDTLIHQLIFDQFKDKISIAFQPRCPKCGERVEPFTGYYGLIDAFEKRDHTNCRTARNKHYTEYMTVCAKGECPRSYKKTKTTTQRTTKVAISRMREVSQDQMLYSVESIAKDQSFSGLVTVSDENLANDVEKYLKMPVCHSSEGRNLEKSSMRLGGGISRGFGQIEIKVNDYIYKDSVEDIESRITSLNNKITETAQFYSHFAKESLNLGGGYFAIDLISDAIVLDDFLKSSLEISGDYLQKILDVNCNIKLIGRYSQIVEHSGWSWAWKLPKGKDQAIQRGSVFLYQCEDLNSLYKPLFDLQEMGIGQKREVGYGRIMVCNPFHEEVYCS